MGSRRRGCRAGAALAALVLTAALAGCAGGEASGSGPIKLGGLFTLSPQPFGKDAQQMAKAVFNKVNENGGVHGRKIKYLTGDDTNDPTKAAQLARQYVGDGVVAMVGSVSFVGCGTNHSYYRKNDVLSIVGIGADPYCFTSSNITPVNIGPFTSITADLYYASKVLDDDKVCVFLAPTPGSKKAQVKAVHRWTKISGQKPAVFDNSIPLNADSFTPYLLRAKHAGCDAVFRNGADTVGKSVLQGAHNQGMTDVDFLFDASSYTAELAESAPSDVNVYLASEFEPFTEKSKANKEWRKLAKKNNIDRTAFTQGAYVSAHWIVSVMKSIDGDITRESVTKALRAGDTYDSPMVGSPLVFGKGDAHAPSQAFKMVSIQDGSWKVESDDFITLPDTSS